MTVRTPPYRTMVRLLNRHPRRFAFACVLGTAAAVLGFVPYLVFWWITVGLIDGAVSSELLLTSAFWLLAAILLRHACFAAATTMSHLAAFDVQITLRRELIEHLFRVPLGLFDKNRESRWRTILVDDVEALEDGLAHLVPETTAIVAGTVVAIALMTWADWRLAVAATLPIVIAAVVVIRMQARARPAVERYHRTWSELNGVASELARGVQVMKIFDDAGQVTARLTRACDDFLDCVDEWVRLCLVPGNLFTVQIGSSLTFSLPLGLLLIDRGAIVTPDLLLVVMLSAGLGQLFVRLADFLSRIGRQESTLARISGVLNTQTVRTRCGLATVRTARLVFENVDFRYGGKDRFAVSGIDFIAEPGQVVALVGPSGGGKSTIVRLAARFFDPDAGRITIGGVDLRDIPPAQLATLVSSVFQDPVLLSDTVAANIRVGREDADDAAVVRAAKDAQAHTFIEALPNGYDTVLADGGRGLSLGQRQRIAIARALLRDAPVLLLDEMTAFADPETEVRVQQAISRLAIGRTVIVIAHRLRTVADADAILVVDSGRIVEAGQHRALLNKGGLYADLWHRQSDQRPSARETLVAS